MQIPTRNPSLKELQEWLRWIITDPRGVREALKHPHPELHSLKAESRPYIHRFTAPDTDCFEAIRSTPPLPTEARLSIYAEGYFLRLASSLERSFKKVYELLGKDAFEKLVADYLKAHPSRFTNIHEVGFYFPDFVSREYPQAACVARIEWAKIEAELAPAKPKVIKNDLASMTQDEWGKAVLSLDPSVRLVCEGSGMWCVYRDLFNEVKVEEIKRFDHHLLRLIKSQKSLSEISEQVAEGFENEHALAFGSKLREWVKKGIISLMPS